jgi:lysophospholipase L1-like esterase
LQLVIEARAPTGYKPVPLSSTMNLRFLLLLTAIRIVGGATPSIRGDFALHEGDTVVFLGDSITAARQYDRVIENYTLLRYPERAVHFVNAGKGGDTMAGGLARLDDDVFDRGATVLFVAFGFNDIGWGLHADDEHKQTYLESLRGIIERCKERGVRVFVCSAAITSQEPDKAETGFFQKMCDEGLELAHTHGAGAVDVQRGMRQIQRRIIAFNESVKEAKDRVSLHVADGVHLSDLGQLAMAFSILMEIGAPADVSAANVDAHNAGLISASGCTITNLRSAEGSLEFDRLDAGWPVNFGTFGALNFRFVPFHSELGRYMLTVANLPPGKYELLAANRSLGVFDANSLAAGVNLCSATADGWEPGGPWDAAAAALKMITDARYEVAYVPVYQIHFLKEHPELEKLQSNARALNAQLEAYQRQLVKPVIIHFLIRPSAKK